MLGQKKLVLAQSFILTIPIWELCSRLNASFWSAVGIITWCPLTINLLITANSSLKLKLSQTDSAQSALFSGNSSRMYCLRVWRTGSSLVTCLIFTRDKGEITVNTSTSCTVMSRPGIELAFELSLWLVSLLNALLRCILVPGLYITSSW